MIEIGDYTYYDDPAGPEILLKTVVAGNPASEIRLRFDAEIIERLLAVAWWNWSVEKITKNIAAISGTNIEALESAAQS